MSALVDAYLSHLAVERRLSPNTVESYGRDLSHLRQFAAGLEQPVEELDRRMIEALVRQLMGEGRSPTSVARAVACFRGFYRFLVVSGHRTVNPAGDLRAPRAWKTLPRFLSVDEVDRLLAAPDTSAPRGLRDRALIEVLYATGLRVSELVNLKPQDVNLESGYLTTTGKGRKQRLVPLGDEAASWVVRYLRDSRPALLKKASSPRLFVNVRRGSGLTRVGFWKILKGYRPAGGPQRAAQSARAATFVCDAPARTRRRPARHPDDAGAQRSVDDADLHPYPGSAAAHGVRPVPSAIVNADAEDAPAPQMTNDAPQMTQMTEVFQRRGVRAAVVLVAFAGLAVWVLLPPAPRLTPPLAGVGPTVRGAYHIHSDRSDGSGTIDAIAEAAQRAGLQFIIVTDHGDGTRVPDAPQYRHGVLAIDAVELNTGSGHLVALGLPAAPYPFAGAAADVIEDVHRLGGFAIAAHPDSPRAALRWDAWDVAVDGVEWINADSGWRDESAASLARAVLGYGMRPAGAIATLLDRPADLLARWDAMGALRSVPVLAAADAHARLGLDRDADPDVSAFHVALPGYEAAFRAFSNHVVLDHPLTGYAPADAPAVVDAIRHGRAFTVVDALATPGGLEFTAAGGGEVARMGGAIAPAPDITLRARISGPPGTMLVLLRNGTRVQETAAAELVLTTGALAGVYRVEAHVPGAPGRVPVPWMLSNPIYVGPPRGTAGPPPSPVVSRMPGRTAEVTIEKGIGDASELVETQTDGASERRLAGEPPIGWRFQLSNGVPAGQFAAVRLPTIGGLADSDRVRFTVTAAAPVRVWVQLRAGRETERWGRTFYADDDTRVVDLPLRSFRPIGATSSETPPLDRIDSLLFVVDTVNNRPGASGSMTIADVAFVR